jgi:hypothetical protein
MRTEAKTFLYLVPWFVAVAVIYALWSGWEPVGSLGILLVAGLALMIGVYFSVLMRRIDPRPEDNPEAVIEEGAGDQGVFSPWSWWPLAIAAAAALVPGRVGLRVLPRAARALTPAHRRRRSSPAARAPSASVPPRRDLAQVVMPGSVLVSTTRVDDGRCVRPGGVVIVRHAARPDRTPGD